MKKGENEKNLKKYIYIYTQKNKRMKKLFNKKIKNRNLQCINRNRIECII